ncbi:hypothetical protein FNF27_02525 [Cafeteria roenbergensis]|nr:hypothetical protein FNF29_04351 [Cafeteria roenbergensis]KAA0176136.1 hypothetical protein FNF27_02525 [Cafeteria roenbergensis]|eukprot:KAA0151665.1 hypothetical protein FNF29_04351 [Cafeteria roenbergensis]
MEKWQRSLAVHREQFSQQADAVDRWDAAVHAASSRLDMAASHLQRLRTAREMLRSKLIDVRAYQSRLGARLDAVDARLSKDAGAQRPVTAASRERREYYTRAVQVNAELSDLQTQAAKLVAQLKSRSTAHGNNAAAAQTVRDILDAHACDLEWLESEAAALERRATAAESKLAASSA